MELVIREAEGTTGERQGSETAAPWEGDAVAEGESDTARKRERRDHVAAGISYSRSYSEIPAHVILGPTVLPTVNDEEWYMIYLQSKR